MKIIAPEDMPLEAWRPGVKTRMLVSAVKRCCAIMHLRTMGGARRRRADPCASGREVLTVREGEAEMWIDEHRVTVRRANR